MLVYFLKEKLHRFLRNPHNTDQDIHASADWMVYFKCVSENQAFPWISPNL